MLLPDLQSYYECPDTKLYVGHVLDVLRELPDKHFHVVITSPPYWGLRDYGIEPTIWGDSDCEHEWGDDGIVSSEAQTRVQPAPQGHCTKCGAWRGCLGLEPTVDLYLEHLVSVFREIWRVLRDDGTLWLNLGDSYAGSGQAWQTSRDGTGNSWGRPWVTTTGRPPGYISSRQPNGIKPKDLIGIPWRVALALQYDGWYLRQDVIWSKPNVIPESVTDRPSKAHEYLFLLSKCRRYFYDAEAIKEDVSPETHARGPRYHPTPKEAPENSRIKNNPSFRAATWGYVEKRNKRSVWCVPTFGFSESHFATFPPDLIKPCILASTSEKGCCPECGKPWIRKVERTGYVPGNTRTKTDSTGWAPVERATTEWQPGCECGIEEVVPCRCLDPFGGAGTTALTARQIGRHSVYIDLSQKYADLAIDRLSGQALPLPLLNVL